MAPKGSNHRKSALLDSGWQDVQRKTFTKWLCICLRSVDFRINTQLDKGEKPLIRDLKTDLCDGVKLLYLLVLSWNNILANGAGNHE
jgi:hypothetical protein